MAFQFTFKRYELKYILNKEQKQNMLELISPYMTLDKYGRSTIRNIYYDTDNYRLIRASIEKPEYKEKLRIRSYSLATPDSTVFVELKKKFKKVVYKRRIALPEKQAFEWVNGRDSLENQTQISKEIEYFRDFYENLSPKVFLSYEREAYFTNDESDFRVTFDENILARTADLSLCSEPYGEYVLDPELTLMEIKCAGGIPLWMAQALSKEKIFKTSFSKYGTAYCNMIYNNNLKEINTYA